MGQSGIPATHTSVQELATVLALGETTHRRAIRLAQLEPSKQDWLRYLDRFLVAAGALLVVAGITAFFAWNWAELHRMARFALIELCVVAAVLLAWRLRFDSTAGRAALFAAAFLVGVLFAVFGQVYQTGADPYGLFLSWAILILPWTLVGRQAPMWLLFLVLLNLTLIMYWTQVLYPPSGWWQLSQLLGPLVWLGTTVMDSRLASWLFALNVGALSVWEVAAARGAEWLQRRSAPRIISLLALYAVAVPTLILIFVASAGSSTNLSVVSPALFAAALAIGLWYYRYKKLDLFVLTALIFGAIMIVMALAIRYMVDQFQSLFLLAALLIGQVAGAAVWLKGVSQRRKAAA